MGTALRGEQFRVTASSRTASRFLTRTSADRN